MKKGAAFSVLILCVLFVPFVFSLDYYIDERIVLSIDGSAYVEGSTNMDLLYSVKPENEKISGRTDELTSKKGPYWLFNYTSDEIVSNYLIKVVLPHDVQVNHISSKSKVLISTENDLQVLTFIGENSVLDIKIQYSKLTDHAVAVKQSFLERFGLVSIVLIAAIVVIISLIFLSRKRGVSGSRKTIDTVKLDTVRVTLNDNQLKIIEALMQKNGEASQTQIRYMSGIPKSSLSRNIEILSQKEIISKFSSGTSNYIKIHPRFYK